MKRVLYLILVTFVAIGGHSAMGQFVESFEEGELDAWETQTGDGQAKATLTGGEGRATLTVDATRDSHNIWWAVLRRNVSADLDLERLQRPDTELRVTARLRVSHAPRRVNLSLNTQRTTDYHSNLMEFDLPDTTGWYNIHMTTDGFDGRPGDSINAQLALMDWGRQTYRAEVDSFAVEIVDAGLGGTASDRAVPYPLPVRSPETMDHHVPVAEGGLVHRGHPNANLADWHTSADSGRTPTWTVTTNQDLLLRWDEASLPDGSVSGPGVLEMVRHSVHHADLTPDEFGQVRVVEILGPASPWDASNLTYSRFTDDRPLHELLTPQPIVDQDVSGSVGEPVHIPISEPVLQRLVDGTSRGLALRPLGPVTASFYAGEGYTPTLHFDLDSEEP